MYMYLFHFYDKKVCNDFALCQYYYGLLTIISKLLLSLSLDHAYGGFVGPQPDIRGHYTLIQRVIKAGPPSTTLVQLLSNIKLSLCFLRIGTYSESSTTWRVRAN